MRSLALRSVATLLPLVLLNCASGGGATSPASAAAIKAPGGTASKVSKASRPKRLALVEADGPGTEVESFVSRLISEASDRGITIVDARLSGAKLAPLAAEPAGSTSRSFQERWPSDAYLGIIVTLPEGKAHHTYMTDVDPSTGQRFDRVIGSVTAEVTASLRVADATDGHVVATIDSRGLASVKGGGETGEPAVEAVLDAAEKAAKKLAKALK